MSDRLLKWIGLRRRPNARRLKIVPNLWGWAMLLALAGSVGVVSFMEYSMEPDFCRSCHLMEPYYQAWHESTHRDVPCGDCHFEPGWQKTVKGKFEASSQAVKYITGTYGSKPHAEVRDASCLRSGCHEKRVLEGKVQWTVPTARGREVTIRFDHTPHMENLRRGKELRCVSCHSQIVQGQHIVVTLDTCFLCHFKGLKHGRDDETVGGCGACHDAPKGEIRLETGVFDHASFLDRGVRCENCHSDSVQGDGAVPRQMCWNCHNQPKDLARYSETAFIHRQHVTEHKVECQSCHVQIEHHLTAGVPVSNDPIMGAGHPIQNSGTCGQCHEKTHNGPLELFRGTGGRGVPDMPSPMFMAQVDCIGCHQSKENTEADALVVGQTFVASQQRCDHCHGKQYDDVLAVWKTQIANHLRDAEAALTSARSALIAANKQGAELLAAERLLDDAEHNIRLVRLGRGAHNVTYATALLNYALDNCERVKGGQL